MQFITTTAKRNASVGFHNRAPRVSIHQKLYFKSESLSADSSISRI